MTGKNIRSLLLALLLWPGVDALAVQADPLPNPPPKVLPDPSPRDSHNFAPRQSTAGIADPGRKLAAIEAAGPDDCSALNPCAMPPPALDNAESVPSRAPSGTHPG